MIICLITKHCWDQNYNYEINFPWHAQGQTGVYILLRGWGGGIVGTVCVGFISMLSADFQGFLSQGEKRLYNCLTLTNQNESVELSK